MKAFQKLSKKAIADQEKAAALEAAHVERGVRRVAANVNALPEAEAKRLLAALLSPQALLPEKHESLTLMDLALEKGDEKTAVFLAQQEPRLLARSDREHQWPLQRAAQEGRVALCKGLLEVFEAHKDDIAEDAEDARRMIGAPLRTAIRKGQGKVAELLLPLWTDSAGPDKDELYDRPLGVAAREEQWKIFAMALAQSSAAEINHCNLDGETIAHELLGDPVQETERTESQALWENLGRAKPGPKDRSEQEATKAFLALASRPDWDAENIENPRQKRIRGKSPLLAAIGARNSAAVNALIPKTDLNAPRSVVGKKLWNRSRSDPMEMHTPLSYSIVTGNVEAFVALLPLSRDSIHKKNIEWQGESAKFTPLEIAKQIKAWDFVVPLARELIEAGKLSASGQEGIEQALKHQTSALPKKMRDYKELFAAAREAFEIRGVVAKASKKAVSTQDAAPATPLAAKPKTMRL